MEFLIFDTFWFWFITGIAWTLITMAEEFGHYIRATIVLLIFLALYYFFSGDQGAGILVMLIRNPLKTMFGILAYFVIGTGWGVIKWFFFVLRERDKVLEKVKNRILPQRETIRAPEAVDHKERIITWMAYWPFSMLWTLINDPVRRAFEWIYRRIGKFMQDISDKIFKGAITAQQKLKTDAEAKAQKTRNERLGS